MSNKKQDTTLLSNSDQNVNSTSKVESSDKDIIAKRKLLRERKRSGLIGTGPLRSLDQHTKPGYKYYNALNTPGRIEELEYLGWEIMTDDNGNPIRKNTKNGNDYIRMHMPKELHEDLESYLEEENQQNDIAVGNNTSEDGVFTESVKESYSFSEKDAGKITK